MAVSCDEGERLTGGPRVRLQAGQGLNKQHQVKFGSPWTARPELEGVTMESVNGDLVATVWLVFSAFLAVCLYVIRG